MLRSMKIWQRLLLVAISFSIPIVILFVFLLREQSNSINFTKKEREGILFLKPTRNLLSHLLQHRDMHIATLAGESSFKAKLSEMQLAIEDDIKALRAQSEELGDYTKATEQLKVVDEAWQDLKKKLPTMTAFQVEQSVLGHARAIRGTMRFLVVLGNESNLVLDPDVDSYYCMDAVIFRLPKLSNDISVLRSQAVDTLLSGLGTDGTRRENLKVLSGTVEDSLFMHRDNIEYGLLANQDLDTRLRSFVSNNESSTKKFLEEIKTQIVVAASVKITPNAIYDSANLAIESNFGLYDSAASELDGLLRARLDTLNGKRYLTLGLVGVSLLLSLILVILLLRSITSPIAELSRIAEKISLGDLDEEIKLVGKDELTELSEKFRRMQTSLKSAMEQLDSKDPL